MTNYNKQKGYTLLFSVITAILVLGVAIFILGVSRKQLILSSTARDSLQSFFNADSGLQCAILNELKTAATSSTPITVNCASGSATASFGERSDIPTGFNSSFPVYQFPAGGDSDYFLLLLSSGCVKVQVQRGYDDDYNERVVISSRGYNQCNSGGPINSIRTVERALLLTQ